MDQIASRSSTAQRVEVNSRLMTCFEGRYVADRHQAQERPPVQTPPRLRLSLDKRALVRARQLEGLVAGNHRDLLVVVPGTLRFRRLLDLEQIHVADHGPILA